MAIDSMLAAGRRQAATIRQQAMTTAAVVKNKAAQAKEAVGTPCGTAMAAGALFTASSIGIGLTAEGAWVGDSSFEQGGGSTNNSAPAKLPEQKAPEAKQAEPSKSAEAKPEMKPEAKPQPKPAPTVRTDIASPNYDSRYGTDISAIILHHTGSDNLAGDLAALTTPNGANSVSSNYLISQEGEIFRLVPDEGRAWHAGEGMINGQVVDVNAASIGIEIENKGDGLQPFTEKQYEALEWLVPNLTQKYDIPVDNVLGHKDIAIPKGRKIDPAANFDTERILDAVKTNG